MSLLAAARSLEFQWPLALWLLAAVPLLAALRARGARRGAARYPGLAAPAPAGALRRRLPAALMLAGLASLLLAAARPQATISLPADARTVMVAIDISGSMRATDVKPTRLAAAQEAAKAFVDEQPSSVRVGVIAVAGSAVAAQAPTRDREAVDKAIDRLQAQRGSALGTGIMAALDALKPQVGEKADAASDAIVFFSDGANNVGPDLEQAGSLASKRGVRVFTVGVGTTEGAVVRADGWAIRARLEDAALKKLASATGGDYFPSAGTAGRQRIFDTMSARLSFGQARPTEVSALFAGLGALLAAIAALLSLSWFDRVF